MTLYLEVTKDKYELPVIVADSIKELAVRTGVKPGAIYKSLERAEKGISKSRFARIEIGE